MTYSSLYTVFSIPYVTYVVLSLYKGLLRRDRHQSYPLLPKFGQPSNSEPLEEILGRTVRFTKGSGQIYYPQKLGSLCEPAGQHKGIMENLGQKQYVRDIGALESALHRPQWMFDYSEVQSIPSPFRMAAGLGYDYQC
ncbi:8227_t:CDS:2 [Paraglomus occultum]|uniref:8227_t:CDS:1 n=1 Tax=Paraglomus occultum TaxID=144539 RepID=A0A9N8ZXT1_9GLOM|nr:8227_t:CDS:2 [Paraglomus occultum]